MGLDGAQGDEQLFGDLLVGLAGGDERKDLKFALAQGLRKFGTGRRGTGSAAFERRRELPEVVRRDVGCEADPLLRFEPLGQEGSDLWSLVYEGAHITLRFG